MSSNTVIEIGASSPILIPSPKTPMDHLVRPTSPSPEILILFYKSMEFYENLQNSIEIHRIQKIPQNFVLLGMILTQRCITYTKCMRPSIQIVLMTKKDCKSMPQNSQNSIENHRILQKNIEFYRKSQNFIENHRTATKPSKMSSILNCMSDLHGLDQNAKQLYKISYI